MTMRNLTDHAIDVVIEPEGDIRSVEPAHGIEVFGSGEANYDVTFDGNEVKIWDERELTLDFGSSVAPGT